MRLPLVAATGEPSADSLACTLWLRGAKQTRVHFRSAAFKDETVSELDRELGSPFAKRRPPCSGDSMRVPHMRELPRPTQM